MSKFPFAAVVAIAVAVAGGAATGYAASPLDGETFTSALPNPDVNSCSSGRISYGFGGTATGPFAGTFMESGTILFGATGAITFWHADFMITDTLGRVTTGTKDLATGGTGTASCAVTGFTAVASATSSSLAYTSSVGTGVAQATVNFTANMSTGVAAGTLSEQFGAPPVTGGGGCDTETHGQGDDQCSRPAQAGHGDKAGTVRHPEPVEGFTQD